MNAWCIVLIAISAVVLLLILPFKVKVRVQYNVLANHGYINLKIGLMGLLSSGFHFGLNKIVLSRKGKKNIQTPLFGLGGSTKLGDAFIYEIIGRLHIVVFRIFAKIGLKDDAAATSVACGALDIPFSIMCCYLLTKKPSTTIYNAVYPDYKNNSLAFAAGLVMKLSLFTVLASLFMAEFKHIKGEGLNGQKQQ